MLNKFIATVITATLSLSTTSAFAADSVKIIKSCYYQDDQGFLQKLILGGYYPVNNISRDQTVIEIGVPRYQGYRIVRISADCVEQNQYQIPIMYLD